MKNDLRKAHFNFGSDKVGYETTNKDTFVGKVEQGKNGPNKEAQAERMQKMRT